MTFVRGPCGFRSMRLVNSCKSLSRSKYHACLLHTYVGLRSVCCFLPWCDALRWVKGWNTLSLRCALRSNAVMTGRLQFALSCVKLEAVSSRIMDRRVVCCEVFCTPCRGLFSVGSLNNTCMRLRFWASLQQIGCWLSRAHVSLYDADALRWQIGLVVCCVSQFSAFFSRVFASFRGSLFGCVVDCGLAFVDHCKDWLDTLQSQLHGRVCVSRLRVYIACWWKKVVAAAVSPRCWACFAFSTFGGGKSRKLIHLGHGLAIWVAISASSSHCACLFSQSWINSAEREVEGWWFCKMWVFMCYLLSLGLSRPRGPRCVVGPHASLWISAEKTHWGERFGSEEAGTRARTRMSQRNFVSVFEDGFWLPKMDNE